MSGVKLDVLWSPVHHDKFVIWGPDITLYEVSRIKEIEKKTTFTLISATRGATVVASQSASGVGCVDISAIPEQPEPLLALGYTNGKVALTTLKQTYDPFGLVGREFAPRHARLCNSVSWSHQETNMLAVAMEKHRSDHCILLWDVYRGSLLSDESRVAESAPRPDADKPIAEMGVSETAHCVSWANFAPRTLVASMNLKYIKIFDLRDLSNKSVNTCATRYCYGVCAEPLGGWQLASRGDSVACVWDVRAFTRPLLTLTHPKPLTQVQWCPTRRNLLLTLQRDSSTLRVHDIQQASDNKLNVADTQTSGEALEAELEEQLPRGPSVIERDVCPSPPAPASPPSHVLAFSWHPALEARLLCVYGNGGLVEHTVGERVTVAWGGRGALAWAGRELRLVNDAHIQDISCVMKKRAQTDYGLKADLWQNADLADDDSLSAMWHFLALSRSLVEDGCIRGSPWRHPGVRGVLRSAGEGGYRSEPVPSLLPDLPHRRVTLFRSAERTRALQLCGWGWGWENALAGVERAEAEGAPCRAAALAAWQLRVRAALDVLARRAGRAARPLPARAAALPGRHAARAAPRRAARRARAPAGRRAGRDRHAPGGPRGLRLHVPARRRPARLRAPDLRRARRAGRPLRRPAHRHVALGPGAAAALGGAHGRRAVGGAGGGALPGARPAAGPAPAPLARQLPHNPGHLAAVVGAVRAGHVGVCGGRGGRGGRGGGGRGGRGAARVRGVHVLRQVGGGAPRAPPAPPRLRAPPPARRQDEANIVVSPLPQAARALRRVLAALGHGGGGRRVRGGGRRGGRQLWGLVQLVCGLQTRGARAASHQLVQGAHGVSRELVQLPLRRPGPPGPPLATFPSTQLAKAWRHHNFSSLCYHH